jgi:hypothetical protein
MGRPSPLLVTLPRAPMSRSPRLRASARGALLSTDAATAFSDQPAASATRGRRAGQLGTWKIKQIVSPNRLKSPTLIRVTTDSYQRVIGEIDRIDEVQKGFSEFLEDMKQPFDPPVYNPRPSETQVSFSKVEHACLDLFHFHKTYNVINDGNKVLGYIRDIANNHKYIEIDQRRFENELSNTRTLLESRRTLIKSRENTFISILFTVGSGLVAAFFGFILLWLLWRHFLG